MQGLWYVALLAAFASLNSCNLGLDLGVTAGAILGIQADLGLRDHVVTDGANTALLEGCQLANTVTHRIVPCCIS